VVIAAAGPPVSRGAGQRLARSELSKPIYHPSRPLLDRLAGLIGSWLNRLYSAGSSFPGGWWGVVALAALLVAVLVVVIIRIGPVARAHGRAGPLASSAAVLRAADHRARASQLALAGDYSGAILECVRAIAGQLEERGLLAPRIGRTADEVAEEAATALPADASALRAAARLFDDVCYGERPGTQAGYAQVRDLDVRITAARPVRPA